MDFVSTHRAYIYPLPPYNLVYPHCTSPLSLMSALIMLYVSPTPISNPTTLPTLPKWVSIRYVICTAVSLYSLKYVSISVLYLFTSFRASSNILPYLHALLHSMSTLPPTLVRILPYSMSLRYCLCHLVNTQAIRAILLSGVLSVNFSIYLYSIYHLLSMFTQ